jgi:hypothetical protein
MAKGPIGATAPVASTSATPTSAPTALGRPSRSGCHPNLAQDDAEADHQLGPPAGGVKPAPSVAAAAIASARRSSIDSRQGTVQLKLGAVIKYSEVQPAIAFIRERLR